MTIRELSKLYYLNKLIERDKLRLDELEAHGQTNYVNCNQIAYDDISKERDKLIKEMKAKISREHLAYMAEQRDIENYINSVEDYQIRLILSYRFVNLLTWQQVANRIGGNNTEDGVKKMCYRYLKKSANK